MKFTFGIITSGASEDFLNQVIDSIEKQKIPEYQILIVGNSSVARASTLIIPFDESVKPAWITRKKNLITTCSAYENIVYTHDYVIFEDGWYQGFLHFGDDFTVCMTKFLNADCSRFRDWVVWPHNNHAIDSIVSRNRECLIPYEMTNLTRYQYISGTYWVAKKHVMQEFPLNDTLCWGQGEDVEWSMRVRDRYVFSLNPYSSVRSLKFKDPVFNVAGEETIRKLKLLEEDPKNLGQKPN
jgi:hypothetical protein